MSIYSENLTNYDILIEKLLGELMSSTFIHDWEEPRYSKRHTPIISLM